MRILNIFHKFGGAKTALCQTATATTTPLSNNLDIDDKIFQAFTSRLPSIEIPDFVHVPQSLFIGGTLRRARLLFLEGQRNVGEMFSQIQSILDPIDITILLLAIQYHRPLLNWLHKISDSKNQVSKPYADSLFGYIEKSITYCIWFISILYITDVAAIFLKALGFRLQGKWDIPFIINTIGTSFIYGHTFVSLKNWFVRRKLRLNNSFNFITSTGVSSISHPPRDAIREATIDDLSTLGIWIAFSLFCLEALSSQLGIGLKSIFALGGIGSASIVLSLKSTFENFSGGILLKLQDKFRVRDVITIKGGEEGVVRYINYLTTTIRRSDNSVAVIPNHVFTQGELINWSRTPYRRFRTKTSLPVGQIHELPNLIEGIKTALATIPEIETKKRDLLVYATSFDGGKISIDVEVHFNTNNDVEAASLRTKVVGYLMDLTSQVDKMDKPPRITTNNANSP